MPDLRSDPAALAFTTIAQRFCILLEHPIRDRELWLAEIHSTLATLYAAAAALRPPPALSPGSPPHAPSFPPPFLLRVRILRVPRRHLARPRCASSLSSASLY